MRDFRKYPRIGNLMVLESAAGFYIGRLYYYAEDEFTPYSRESTYMTSREIAERALRDNDYIENLNSY